MAKQGEFKDEWDEIMGDLEQSFREIHPDFPLVMPPSILPTTVEIKAVLDELQEDLGTDNG